MPIQLHTVRETKNRTQTDMEIHFGFILDGHEADDSGTMQIF